MGDEIIEILESSPMEEDEVEILESSPFLKSNTKSSTTPPKPMVLPTVKLPRFTRVVNKKSLLRTKPNIVKCATPTTENVYAKIAPKITRIEYSDHRIKCFRTNPEVAKPVSKQSKRPNSRMIGPLMSQSKLSTINRLVSVECNTVSNYAPSISLPYVVDSPMSNNSVANTVSNYYVVASPMSNNSVANTVSNYAPSISVPYVVASPMSNNSVANTVSNYAPSISVPYVVASPMSNNSVANTVSNYAPSISVPYVVASPMSNNSVANTVSNYAPPISVPYVVASPMSNNSVANTVSNYAPPISVPYVVTPVNNSSPTTNASNVSKSVATIVTPPVSISEPLNDTPAKICPVHGTFVTLKSNENRTHFTVDTHSVAEPMRRRSEKKNKIVEDSPKNNSVTQTGPIRPKLIKQNMVQDPPENNLDDVDYKLVRDGSEFKLVLVPKNLPTKEPNNVKKQIGQRTKEPKNSVQNLNVKESSDIRLKGNFGDEQIEDESSHRINNRKYKKNFVLKRPRKKSTENRPKTGSNGNYLNKNRAGPQQQLKRLSLSGKKVSENENYADKVSVDQATQTEIHCWLLQSGDLFLYSNGEDDIDNALMFTKVPIKNTFFTRQLRDSCVQTDCPSTGVEECKEKDTCSRSNINLMEEHQTGNLGSGDGNRTPRDETNLFFQPDPMSNMSSNKNRPLRNINNLPRGLLMNLYNDIKTCLKEDEFGNIPLHQAVLDNDLNRVKCQCLVMKGLDLKANINYTNEDNETALMLAVKRAVVTGWTDMVEYMIGIGADQTIPDSNGCFPLHYAVRHGDLKLTRILLSDQNAVSVVNRTFQGFAALHLAAMGGHSDVIELLLDMGAHINVKDRKCGRTPFYLAVENKQVPTSKLLSLRGADVMEPNFAGQVASGLYPDGGDSRQRKESKDRKTDKSSSDSRQGIESMNQADDSSRDFTQITKSNNQADKNSSTNSKTPRFILPKINSQNLIISQNVDNIPTGNIDCGLKNDLQVLNNVNVVNQCNTDILNPIHSTDSLTYYFKTAEGNIICLNGRSLLQSSGAPTQSQQSGEACITDALENVGVKANNPENRSSGHESQIPETVKVNSSKSKTLLDNHITVVDIDKLIKNGTAFSLRTNNELPKATIDNKINEEIVDLSSDEVSESRSEFETGGLDIDVSQDECSQEVIDVSDDSSIHSVSSLCTEEYNTYEKEKVDDEELTSMSVDHDKDRLKLFHDSESRTLKRNHDLFLDLDESISNEESPFPQEKKWCNI